MTSTNLHHLHHPPPTKRPPKEQDAETGLDYFGARYYMPALGRWAAVDPSADAMPEWSTYNYAYDNPALQTDPDGRQAGTAAAMAGTGWMKTAEWFRNMSPENQMRAMRGEIQPPNGDYQFAHMWDPIGRDLGRVVVGVEGVVPLVPGVPVNVGVSADLSGSQGLEVSPIVSIGAPGVNASVGVITSLPREGDVNASGTVVSPIGIGVSQGVAVNDGSVRPTDTRIVVGTPQARSSIEVSVGIPVSSAPTASPSGPTRAQNDATVVRRPPTPPPEPPRAVRAAPR